MVLSVFIVSAQFIVEILFEKETPLNKLCKQRIGQRLGRKDNFRRMYGPNTSSNLK